MYGEVSFNHRILFQFTTTSVSTRSVTIISDCLDYGVSRILSRTTRDAQKQRARRFQSLLMIVEAKAQRAVNETIPGSSLPPIPATKTQN